MVVHQVAHPEPAFAEERSKLLLSEILTGGTSATDEYVRIEASGAAPIALDGVELIYVSASGLTTRRLVTLDPTVLLAPGASILLAHALGSFGPAAHQTWSDGIASSGGVLQIRRVGTPAEILDAVAWGSASVSAGGEGLPVPEPPAGTPLKRARSASGSLVDTDMNSADFSADPSSSPTPLPTSSLLPSPTPSSTSSPSPSPTSTPTPSAISISEARLSPVGTHLGVRGVLTAIPGELAEPLLAALADPIGGSGIFVLLPPTSVGLLRGQLVEVSGLITLRRQTLTLFATSAPQLVGSATAPTVRDVQRPAPGVWAWEAWEGRRIRVEGVLAGSPTSLAGGAISLKIRLDSGEELLAAASSGVALTLPTGLQESGRRVRAEGLIHQRGSVGGGGYRLWLDPLTGLTAVPQETPSGGLPSSADQPMASAVPNPLPLGAPTIAVPVGMSRARLREIVTSLRVDSGRLELWREGVIRLVVLPSCGEPVDHEGEAPYPEPR